MSSPGAPQQVGGSCPGSHLSSTPLWFLREAVQQCLLYLRPGNTPPNPKMSLLLPQPHPHCRAAAGTLTRTGSPGIAGQVARGGHRQLTALRALSRPAGLPDQVWSPELLEPPRAEIPRSPAGPGRAAVPAAQHRDKRTERPGPARAVPQQPCPRPQEGKEE